MCRVSSFRRDEQDVHVSREAWMPGATMPESSKQLNRKTWIPGLRYAPPGMTD